MVIERKNCVMIGEHRRDAGLYCTREKERKVFLREASPLEIAGTRSKQNIASEMASRNEVSTPLTSHKVGMHR